MLKGRSLYLHLKADLCWRCTSELRSSLQPTCGHGFLCVLGQANRMQGVYVGSWQLPWWTSRTQPEHPSSGCKARMELSHPCIHFVIATNHPGAAWPYCCPASHSPLALLQTIALVLLHLSLFLANIFLFFFFFSKLFILFIRIVFNFNPDF